MTSRAKWLSLLEQPFEGAVQPPGLSRKVSDEYTVPVCRVHHRDLHGYGDEASWWAGISIDPQPIALERWQRSRVSELSVSARAQ
jgi:hypothetical protein